MASVDSAGVDASAHTFQGPASVPSACAHHAGVAGSFFPRAGRWDGRLSERFWAHFLGNCHPIDARPAPALIRVPVSPLPPGTCYFP